MSDLVGNTEDRFSRVVAHMVLVNCFLKIRSTESIFIDQAALSG